MRMKYFGWEYVFEHICQHCDRDGMWDGDGSTLAAEFNVTEDEGHEMLSDLADHQLIERVGTATYIITQWRERDDAGEQEVTC